MLKSVLMRIILENFKINKMSIVIDYISDLNRKIHREKLNGNRPHVIEEYQKRLGKIVDINNLSDKEDFAFSTVTYHDQSILSKRIEHDELIQYLSNYLNGLLAHSKEYKHKVAYRNDEHGNIVLKLVKEPLTIAEENEIQQEIQRVINQINQLHNE